MKRLPHAREVDRAFRLLRTEVRTAFKALNGAAGQAMAKGDYGTAEGLAAKGREMLQFQEQLDGLLERWRGLRGESSSASKNASIPLWAYYQPVLRALVECGGEANLKEIESRVFAILRGELQVADHRTMAGGRERWQVMVHRSRKQLVTEGWLEPGSGAPWRITAAGRQAALSSQQPEAP